MTRWLSSVGHRMCWVSSGREESSGAWRPECPIGTRMPTRLRRPLVSCDRPMRPRVPAGCLNSWRTIALAVDASRPRLALLPGERAHSGTIRHQALSPVTRDDAVGVASLNGGPSSLTTGGSLNQNRGLGHAHMVSRGGSVVSEARFMRRCFRAVPLAIALVILAAQPASAYTIAFNNYPNSPLGCSGVPSSGGI